MTLIIVTATISAIVSVAVYALATTFLTKNSIKKQRAAALKEAEAEETVEEAPAESFVGEEPVNPQEPVEPEPDKIVMRLADEKLIDHAVKYVEDRRSPTTMSTFWFRT